MEIVPKGAYRTPKIGCLYQSNEIQHFYCFATQLVKKTTAMVFIEGDRGYPTVRFEYKMASERYLVTEI